jgi:acyl-CoA reductase-like NAD-dependent aldehyde dehydrogenase
MSSYATTNPATGTVVREFELIDDATLRHTLVTADQTYTTWSRAKLRERADVVQRVADLYRQHAEELAQLATLEMGKPIVQARGEIALAASIYEYYARSGPGLLADEELEIAGTGRAVVRTAPLGVLLGIMPWNFPHYQVARFVAPNLLLGNTIVMKHAESCPQQALRIGELIGEAGAPHGAYANIFATRDQVAALIADPLVHGVSITGSERAGRAVGELAGRHLKKAVLELGGSDAFIVRPTADLDQAVQAAALGRFGNAGQACTSSKRLIIDSLVWADFLSAFVTSAGEWAMGDPREESTRLGPLASLQARQDLAAQVQDAIDKGATVHLGGQVPDGAGSYYPATVLSGVTPDMRAFREELFGPVAVLYEVGSLDEALVLANDSAYGLGAAVFTGVPDEASYVTDELEVGMVGLNMTIKSAPDLPFGGVKSSGVGRELGRFGLDEFCNKKLIRFA